MKKKIISLFLSVVMVLTMVPTYSFMAYADDTASANTVVDSGIDNVDGEDEEGEDPTEPTEPECTHVFTEDKLPADDNSFWETHSKSDYYVGSKAFIDAELPASCTEDGWSIAKTETTGFCMICGQVITEGDKKVLNSTGHSFADAEEYVEGVNCENFVQPTCTTDGSAECKNTNAKLTAVFNEATGLYEANVEFIPCTETVDIDALGHDLVAAETVNPDCENGGYTVYECSRCDYKENKDVVPALGHVEGKPKNEYYTAPTCTEPGAYHMVTRCTRCDKVLKDEAVDRDEYPALGHDLGDMHWGTIATCTEDGTLAYCECNRCGKYFTKKDNAPTNGTEITDIVAPKLGHDYVAVETTYAPGTPEYCLNDDIITYTCSRCGDTYIDTTREAVGHIEADAVVENEVILPADANCGDVVKYDWDEVVYCENCGTEVKREAKHSEDAPLPHIPGDKVVTETVVSEPTCTEKGITSVRTTVTCERCGEILEDNTVEKETPENGHVEGTPYIEYNDKTRPYIQPTCTEEGSYYIVTKCTVCGVVLEDEKKILPPLGHDYVATVEAYAEGTEDYCTKDDKTTYVCTRCNDTYVEITRKATGHQYEINKKSTVYPTCEREGHNYYTCAKCGTNTLSEPIPPLGHLTPANYDSIANCQHGDQYICQRETYEEDADNHRVLDENGDFIVNGVCGVFIEEGEKNTALKFNDEYKNVVVLPNGENQVHLPSIAIPQCAGKDADVYLARGEFDPDNLVDYSVVDGKLVTGHAEATFNGTDYDIEKFYTYEFFEATCEFDAYYVFTCKCCNGSEENGVFVVELINTAIGHRWALRDDLTNRDPSCTQDGTRYWYCLNDNGHQYTEKIPATGHNYKLVDSIAATCTESGYNLYKCVNTAEDNDPDSTNGAVCGEEYREFTTPALGHDFAEDVTQYVAPGCNTEGKRVYVCKRTDCTETYTVVIPKTDNHTYTLISTTPATCTEEGTATYKCQDAGCDAQYTINTTPRTGHQYIENKNMFVAPTCVAQGYRYFECVNDNDGIKCDAHYSVVLAKVAHTPVSANNAVAATCTRAGKKADTICSVCGVTIASGDVIPATGHNYGKVNVENPTCTDKGYTIHSCTNPGCNDMYIDTYTAKIPHTLEVAETVPAICGEDGFVKKRCTNCDYTVTEILPATGNHQYICRVTVQPTCTTKGVMTYTCTTCKYTLIEEIPMLVHSAVSAGNAVAPTCTKAGKESDTICSACGVTLATGSAISATGHNYGKVDVVPATCQTEGYTVHICTNDNCGYSYITDKTDIAEHVIKDTKTIPATCISDGSVMYECANCSYSFYEILPATGHNYSKTDVVNPTCTDKGHTVHTCTNPGCDAFYVDDYTAVIDHVMEKTETVNATCTTDGYVAYKCNNCTYETKEILPATGHSWVVKDVQPATCTAEGFTTYGCENCDAERVDDKTPIDNTAHNYVVTEKKEATCTSEGYDVYTCNNIKGYDVEADENGEVVKETPIYCGDTYKVTTTPKTGHSYKAIKYTPATCIANGYWTNECTVCKNITTVEDNLTATGHDWVESFVKASTAKDGAKTTACALCGISSTERIAKIAKVELSATKFTYTGKQIKPVVTVIDVDGKVISSANYTVTYKNNKKIGKATVTVAFKGSKYEGVVNKTFTIIPKKAGISDIHSGKKSIKFTWGRVGNCSGYQIQYSTSKSFKSKKTITIKSKKTVTKNIKGLKSGKKYYIRIRTYKTVNGKKIYGEWNTTKKARIAK